MFKQWEIWYYDQVKSRMNSDPQQPIDPSGKTRMYIIVSPDAQTLSGGNPVCIAVGTKQHSAMLDAEIKAGEGNVKHNCYAWCSEYFTLNTAYFRNRVGILPEHVISDIRDGIRDFFELH
jgi:mRNA-degrading endonuclease toxin of MazEF toxin-antitoxin module